MVLEGPEARAVPVSINPSQVGVAMMSSDHVIGMGSLLPGILVKASIKEVIILADLNLEVIFVSITKFRGGINVLLSTDFVC